MSEQAPPLNVVIDGSGLAWGDGLEAVDCRFFFWKDAGTLFETAVVLTALAPQVTIASDTVRRWPDQSYLCNFVYRFAQPPIDPPDPPMPGTQAKDGAGRGKSFVGPFLDKQDDHLLVPAALELDKIVLAFFPDCTIAGQAARARLAQVRLGFEEAMQSAPPLPGEGGGAEGGAGEGTGEGGEGEGGGHFVFNPEHAVRGFDVYRNDTASKLHIEVRYLMEPQEGVPHWIVQDRQAIAPQTPAIYLRADLAVCTIESDANAVAWHGSDPVALVLVDLTLHEGVSNPADPSMDTYSFATIAFDRFRPLNTLRTLSIAADAVPQIAWRARYYFASGQQAEIGNPPNQPLMERKLVLPPVPDSPPPPGCSPFVLVAPGQTGGAAP